ncbi:MAG: hypothetical protein PHY99_03455, partial [Bacteroidales bacterium]|nr:hypothetical protein [Bacteroidales bacterium]
MKTHQTLKPVISLLIILLCSPHLAICQDIKVDYRYAPPFWQSTICLPDDPYKTLADEHGNLRIHPFPVNQYGEPRTQIGIDVTDHVVWVGQEIESSRMPIMITRKSHPDFEITEEAFTVTWIPDRIRALAIPLSDEPDMDRGTGKEEPRNAVILVRIRNTSNHDKVLSPSIRINSSLPVSFLDNTLTLNNREKIGCSLPLDPSSLIISEKETHVKIGPVHIKPGQTITFAVMLYGGGALARWPVTLDQAIRCKKESELYWKSVDLPYNRITVPDPGIQDLIDASVRNIWQAREIKKGLPAFQVGPTCYRGLWIVDGAFILEAATILGIGEEARNGVMYNLSFQKEDGRF